MIQSARASMCLRKCRLAADNINYLGHIITTDSNLPQSSHLERIKNFPEPRTVRELRQFLGTANWLRDYVRDFATTAAPMTDLLATKTKFRWTAAAQEAFEALKGALAGQLRLSRPLSNEIFAI